MYARVDVLTAYQLIADEHEAGVIRGVALFRDEAEESLLRFVVRAIRDLVQWVLVHHLFGFWLLDGDAVHRDSELHLGGLSRLFSVLGLSDLLVKLQLLNTLLHHVDALRLIHCCAAKELKKDSIRTTVGASSISPGPRSNMLLFLYTQYSLLV